MTDTIDLNADMGESFGAWSLGDDTALLDVVTSANIACGFHAGDWDTMAHTMQVASDRDVGIGAHPGFPDLQGFGRRRMDMAGTSLGNLVRYQIGAAQAMAQAAGGRVRHVKLHGALANMASEDKSMALACYRAALSVDPELIVMVLAQTAQQAAVEEIGCRAAYEIFADRAYNDDATLVDRRIEGSVIHDPEIASVRVLEMLQAQAIVAQSGKRIPTRIDTVCMHGDSPNAVALSRNVRTHLEANGVVIRAFEGHRP